MFFLDLADILMIHEDQIERYGGDPGVRDGGLLESAIAQPSAGFHGEYLHRDIYEMAAAYLFHICNNHPFIDGNKRTALAVCRTFLALNECDLDATQEEKYESFMSLARGELTEQQLAAWIRGQLSTGS